MFYTCNYNIRVTHRNGAIKHIFYTNQIHGGSSADCSLFILSLHALALHLAVKILLQIFLYEDLTRWPYICRLYFPQNASRYHFVTQPILLSENIPLIFDINHQQNTRRSDQIETIKTCANYAPSYHMEGFTNGSVAIFKEIFDQMKKI